MKNTVRVVGGTDTTINEYPWMALLRLKSQSKSSFFCGGSLINAKWILTAQHCIFSAVNTSRSLGESSSLLTLFSDTLEIRLGEHQLNTIDETLIVKDFNVNLIVKAPNYNIPKSTSNDIALVRLSEEVGGRGCEGGLRGRWEGTRGSRGPS